MADPGQQHPGAARRRSPTRCSGFGQWLQPAAIILPGVYLLQRCGRLAATGLTSPTAAPWS